MANKTAGKAATSANASENENENLPLQARPLHLRCDVSDLTGATIWAYAKVGNKLFAKNIRIDIGREAVVYLPDELLPREDALMEAASPGSGTSGASASSDSRKSEDKDVSEGESADLKEVVQSKDRELEKLRESYDDLKREIESMPVKDDELMQKKVATQEKQIAEMSSERSAFAHAEKLLDDIFVSTVNGLTVARLEAMQKDAGLPPEGRAKERKEMLTRHYREQDLTHRMRLVAAARKAEDEIRGQRQNQG